MNERIESYFNQQLPPVEREQFENELLHDPTLADEVAFYLRAQQVIREQLLAERHAEWQKMDSMPAAKSVAQVRRLSPWYYAAAAVFLLAIAWVWLSVPTPTVRELAGTYVEENFTTLSVQMGGEVDSLQTAIQQYNEGRFGAAQTISEQLLHRNAVNAEALKLLGIIALRQQHYEQAVTYFNRLAERQDLYANPGKFYQALTYLQRGYPADLAAAQKLLQSVVSENLEGRPQAEKWLKTLDEN